MSGCWAGTSLSASVTDRKASREVWQVFSKHPQLEAIMFRPTSTLSLMAESTGTLHLSGHCSSTGKHPADSQAQGNYSEHSLRERERSNDTNFIEHTKCSSQKCPIQVSVLVLHKKSSISSVLLRHLDNFLLFFSYLFIPSWTFSKAQECSQMKFAKAAEPGFEFTSRQLCHFCITLCHAEDIL